MSEHCVVTYVVPGAPRFTATARKASARLSAVDNWATNNGFTQRNVVGRGLSKSRATALKLKEIAKYESRGFVYVPRPAE